MAFETEDGSLTDSSTRDGSATPEPAAPPAAPKPAQPPWSWKWVIITVVALLVIYPVVRRIVTPQQSASTTNRAAPANSTEADLVNLSAEHCHAGRLQDCIAAAKQALAINPNSADAYNNIAAAYMSLGMPKEAFQNIQESLRLRPDYELAQNNRTWILQEMGKKVATTANAPGGKTPEFYVNQSLQFYQAGRYAETIAAAKEALKLKPDMVEAHNNLAAGYMGLHKWDEAIAESIETLRLKPDYGLAQNNLKFSINERSKQPASAPKKK